MRTTSILAFGLALGAGCTDELPVTATVQAIIEHEPGGDYCPTFGCGNNTSIVDQVAVTDVSETGAYNKAGFRLVRFEMQDLAHHWHLYRADVVNGTLQALPLEIGQPKKTGPSVQGARFTFYSRDTRLTYYLFVDDFDQMLMWSKDRAGYVPTADLYRLKWVEKQVWDDAPSTGPSPLVDICGANPDGSGMPDYLAVLFDDDRIDVDTIRVTAETKDWFTIGCAGSALAKQHLLGHTKAAAAIQHRTPTTLDQRTANLKMITADYCGLGHPFTVPGTPLNWRDSTGRYDTVQSTQSTQIEARWNENGATCLNVPRIDYRLVEEPNGDAHDAFPDGVSRMLDPQWDFGWCNATIPPCQGNSTNPYPSHITTVNAYAQEEPI